MKLKKRLAAGFVSAACFASMLSVMPALPYVHADTLVDNTFEDSYEGWYGSGDSADVTAVENAGVNGSRGMLVSKRASAEEGAASSKGLYLFGGVKHKYSVQVYSETDETFRISLLYKNEDTEEETVVQLAEKNVKGGEWTDISATFKAPENSYEYLITITTDSTNDFVFDNFKVTTKENQQVLVAEAAGNGLKDAYKGYGFRVGNILNGGTVKNSAILANILKDCNAIECENETKADAILRASGSTNTNVNVSLQNCAAIADFASKNNIAFRGHAFVWHSQTPDWWFKEGFSTNGAKVSPSTMNQRLDSYIKNTFAAFKSQYPNLNIYAYDVCNECANGDGGPRPAGYDNISHDGASGYVKVYGDNSFIETAFTIARKYAPSTCKLYYNDFNEFYGPKKNYIINSILKPLSAKGVLDGMGMQSHMNCAAKNAWGDTQSYLQAMDEYLAVGVDVQVTELDLAIDSGQSLQDQTNKYRDIVSHIQQVNTSGKYKGKVTLFQVWGPNDSNTWISGDKSPTLYDKSNQPKQAYNTLMQMGDGNGPFGDSFDIVPEPPKPDKDGYWIHYTFENGVEGMAGRGGASVEQSSAAGYESAHSLFTSGRTDTWNGAATTLSPVVFKAGESYSFSADFMYKSGSATEEAYLSMEYKDASGTTQWPHIAEITAMKGEWAQLKNVSFKIPEGATDISIYVEMPNSTSDFYVDEVIVAPEGTEISGPKTINAKPMPGDVDCDGKLTAADLSLQKRGIKSAKYMNAISEMNADVDQSGEIDAKDVQLLQQFLLGKIDEFPVAERKVDFTEMAKKFAGVTPVTSLVKDNENNPLTSQRFGADPGWMVYEDRLYLFTTNDQYEGTAGGTVTENSYNSGTINCISSADLVNWTDHGAIPVAARNGRTQNGAAKWASNAWAPDAAWKMVNGKPKFFLYFADNGSGIGVLTADSPLGPWTDPIGKQLVSRSTPNCGNVAWLFDPGVYYDDKTDEAYLFFGGGKNNDTGYDNPKTGRCVKLGKDMISLDGTPQTMETPYLFEDSSIIKIGDTWYYSYCTNWNVPGGTNINGASFGSGDICYMTNTNPMGPWTRSQFRGRVFQNTGSQGLDQGGNNHHSIIYFKGQYYVSYHSRQLEMRMYGGKNLNYRATCLDKATLNGDGTITCKGSQTGVSQIETLNPYEAVQAETFAQLGANFQHVGQTMTNVKIEGVGDTVVTGMKTGDWFRLKGVDLGSTGPKSMTAKVSSQNGGAIKVCTGSPTGEAFTYIDVPAGSKNAEITVPTLKVTGEKDVYFVFYGDVSFDCWKLNK